MLKSNALTTVDRACGFMGISVPSVSSVQYTVVENLINSATDWIENYLGYTVKQTTYLRREYDTERGTVLLLEHYPINENETFVLERRDTGLNDSEWETVNPQFYFVDYDSGIVEAVNGMVFIRGRKQYRVTYTAGFNFNNSTTFLSDTKGGAIELACWMIVSSLWNKRKSGTGIDQESLHEYSIKYSKDGIFASTELTELLSKYTRIDPVGVLTPLQ